MNAVSHSPGNVREPHRAWVLVVDDDVFIRESICALLDEEGYLAVAASNGLEALEILQRPAKPALILLDLMMPVMSGFDFRERQLADPATADIPVVVLTAAGLAPARALSPQGVLIKPFPGAKLLEMVSRFCAPCAH